MNSIIMDILSKSGCSITERMTLSWEYIQNEQKKKGRVAILRELLDNSSVSDSGIMYLRNPINILLYEDERDLTLKEMAENLCIPLTEENFKLIIKELLFCRLLIENETANFEPAAYNDVLLQVLSAF